jgi:hypothetical protein
MSLDSLINIKDQILQNSLLTSQLGDFSKFTTLESSSPAKSEVFAQKFKEILRTELAGDRVISQSNLLNEENFYIVIENLFVVWNIKNASVCKIALDSQISAVSFEKTTNKIFVCTKFFINVLVLKDQTFDNFVEQLHSEKIQLEPNFPKISKIYITGTKKFILISENQNKIFTIFNQKAEFLCNGRMAVCDFFGNFLIVLDGKNFNFFKIDNSSLGPDVVISGNVPRNSRLYIRLLKSISMEKVIIF